MEAALLPLLQAYRFSSLSFDTDIQQPSEANRKTQSFQTSQDGDISETDDESEDLQEPTELNRMSQSGQTGRDGDMNETSQTAQDDESADIQQPSEAIRMTQSFQTCQDDDISETGRTAQVVGVSDCNTQVVEEVSEVGIDQRRKKRVIIHDVGNIPRRRRLIDEGSTFMMSSYDVLRFLSFSMMNNSPYSTDRAPSSSGGAPLSVGFDSRGNLSNSVPSSIGCAQPSTGRVIRSQGDIVSPGDACLDPFMVSISQAADTYKESQRRISSLDHTIEGLKAELKEFNEFKAEVKDVIREKNHTIEELRAQINDLIRECDDLKLERDGLHSEMLAIRESARIANSSLEIERHRSKSSALILGRTTTDLQMEKDRYNDLYDYCKGVGIELPDRYYP